MAPNGLADLDLVLDRRIPAGEQVYATLREAIVCARLMPGELISENAVCRQFNVSRTPVRAAIQRLVEDGLVTVFPQFGSFVSEIDIETIRDSHFVRRSLEVCLLREVSAVWLPGMSGKLRELVSAQKGDIAVGDVDGFFRDDEEFHRLFSVFVNRPGVWETIYEAKAKLTRFHRFAGSPTRFEAVVEEHLAILDALDAGDVAGAEAAMITHLDKIFVLFDAHALGPAIKNAPRAIGKS